MKDKRSLEMDVIKGLGIIAIVIGHTESPLLRFVYSYHVVLFFFISGYFYKDKYTHKPITLIKKRIKTLYIPFIAYELIFLVLHNFFIKFNVYHFKYYSMGDFISSAAKILTFHEIQSEVLGQFWFIKVLFITNIIFFLIDFVFCKIKGFKKEILQGILFLVLFVIDVVATQHIGNNKTAFTVPTASLVPVSLLAFWAGNIYKKYKAHVSLNIYFAIISLIGIIISCQFVGTNMGNFFIYPAVFLVNSVLGIYLNLYLSKILVEKNAYKIIEIIGKNSLTILALHIICFKAINLAQIYIYNLSYSYLSHRIINMNNFWWIAYSIVGVLIPVILALGANKVLLFLKKIISKQLA